MNKLHEKAKVKPTLSPSLQLNMTPLFLQIWNVIYRITLFLLPTFTREEEIRTNDLANKWGKDFKI